MRVELKALLRLATPIAAASLGFMLLGVVDTAVVGRLGETELGAVGLGNALFFTFALFGTGLVMGVDPLVSQALGAGDARRARVGMWQGVWVAAVISLPVMALTWASAHYIDRFGIEASTARGASEYVNARLLALPSFCIFSAQRAFLEAHGHTRPLVVSVVVANILNLPLDWLLVFGDAGLERLGLSPIGMPALGVAGAGYTSAAVQAVQLLIGMEAVRRTREGIGCGRGIDGPLTRKALRLGFPIALQRLAEVGVFSLAGVLMAKIGTRAVASHQVAMTLASATFMVPLGISHAAAVRVGRAVGAGDEGGARRAGQASFLAAGTFMAACGVALLLFPDWLSAVLTDQQGVIDAARPLLAVAALFQLSDGLQVVGAGALRGLGDTQSPLWLNLAGHYLLGLPIGIALAFVAGWGAVGLWWGLFAGLTAVAVTLLWRFSQLARRGVQPV